MDVQPRTVRPAPTPLALYIRLGRNDHTVLASLLTNDLPWLSGLVLDPSIESRHDDVRVEAMRRRVETILDPLVMELATPGGFTEARANLPWAGKRVHERRQFDKVRVVEIAQRLASHMMEKRYS